MTAEADSDDERLHALSDELRRLIWQLRRRLREQADIGDFTPSQITALIRLEAQPATVTQLAHALGVRPQSMGSTVAALEAAGVVVGQADPADGRKTIWSLTEEVREKVSAARVARSDWLVHTIRRELDEGEQAQLAAALVLLRRLVEA